MNWNPIQALCVTVCHNQNKTVHQAISIHTGLKIAVCDQFAANDEHMG